MLFELTADGLTGVLGGGEEPFRRPSQVALLLDQTGVPNSPVEFMDASHGGVPPTAPARQGEVLQSFDGRGLERPLMRPVETPLQSLQDDREALGPPHADADGRVDEMRHVDGDALVQPERRPRIPRPRARKPLDIDEPFVDGRRLLYTVFQNNPNQIE